MDRDTSPPRARPAPGAVPALLLAVDQLLDEFTRLPGQAEFRFDPATPAVVTVEFLAERGPGLVWRLGRELLYRGLATMSGCGDVRMWPTQREERPSSWLLLESPELEALFELPTAPLTVWLDATYRAVPAGAELDGLDWDDFLLELLEGPGVPFE
ncbi:SsgA family sporulation/cell division regulator [Kitasatospora sp. NPDC097605]|uniref:SsgA family sporulation/cell division regulator n=1 Tax=Kitasatospora sp. NPDC097605 TaxID=3157226 RepID=UPI00331F3160